MGAAWAISGLLRISFTKKHNDPDSPYAFGVILIFLLTILDNLLRPTFIPMIILRSIYPITRLSYFLVGPSLLLYTSILLRRDFKLNRKYLLHLLPFIIGFIYITIDPASMNPSTAFASESLAPKSNIQNPIFSFSAIWDFSMNLSRLSYSFLILVMIKKHKESVEDKFSTLNTKTTLSWFKYLVIFYTAIYLIFSILNILLPNDSLAFQISGAMTRSLPAVLFVFLFPFFSEEQVILVNNTTKEEEIINNSETKESKYKKSGTSEDEIKSIYLEVCQYLENSKIYLESDLTLNTLSDKVGITRHKLSESINREANKRFYLFINDFRLKEFINSIRINKYPSYTIISIAYECGFGSSSGFYNMVKSEYGMTPKALVKEIAEGNIE
jgi:AraC-like DNA-binding protein